MVVPDGFAARVARRAFAGDPGVLVPHAAEIEPTGSLLPFVLKLSALAAGLLFAFSIGIRMTSLPSGAGMNALEKQPAVWPEDSGKAGESEDSPEDSGEEE